MIILDGKIIKIMNIYYFYMIILDGKIHEDLLITIVFLDF